MPKVPNSNSRTSISYFDTSVPFWEKVPCREISETPTLAVCLSQQSLMTRPDSWDSHANSNANAIWPICEDWYRKKEWVFTRACQVIIRTSKTPSGGPSRTHPFKEHLKSIELFYWGHPIWQVGLESMSSCRFCCTLLINVWTCSKRLADVFVASS